MSKKSILPQSPRHILVYDKDWEYLNSLYGKSGVNPIGISVAIRQILHAFCKKAKARENQAIDEQSTVQ
jgi:hypothetical protein